MVTGGLRRSVVRVGLCRDVWPMCASLGVDEHFDHFADQAVVADLEELGLVACAVGVSDGAVADLLDEDVELVVDAAALLVQRFEVVLGPVRDDHVRSPSSSRPQPSQSVTSSPVGWPSRPMILKTLVAWPRQQG